MNKEQEYKASQEMVDILIQHGFTEITMRRNEMHWQRLQRLQSYSPYSVKRFFRKGHVEVYFDYIDIRVSYNGRDVFSEYQITSDQFKSLLFFGTLSSAEKNYFSRREIPFLEIGEFLMKEEEEYMYGATKNRFVEYKTNYKRFSVDLV